jgi:HPt (histidine-containing phosphotransfer) domain-containing protein
VGLRCVRFGWGLAGLVGLPVRAGEAGRVKVTKQRVLFVGEGPRSSEMVALLERRRHDVFHALDADQAIEALHVQRFGLVVCDASISRDRLQRLRETADSPWLVELHDSDDEPSLKRRTNGAGTEAVIAGLGNLERVTELLDRLLVTPGEFVANPSQLSGLAPLGLKVLDHEKFAGQMNHDPEMMAEIIDLYLAETKNQLRELESLVRQNERLAACRLAHTLKGSFGAVYASRAGALAREIETALATGDLGLAAALLDPLKESAADAENALHQFL